MPVKKTSDLPAYLKGAVAVRDKKLPERLKFFFRYLQNEDFEIANDALKEFGNANYTDVAQIADDLSAETIAGWLEDKRTPPHRIGLYALLLGLCSKDKEKHARLLRGLIDDPDRQLSGGVDGILAAQVLLQPKEGWEFLGTVLKDRKRGFLVRYAALRAARFFIDTRKDVIPRKDVIDAVSLLLEQTDIADLAIEDLRRWKEWKQTKKVLELKDRQSHDTAVIRRGILRFMLSSPEAEAKAYIAEMRKADPDLVEAAEELLKIEEKNPNSPPRTPGSN
jgi:hypothetical protein